MRNAVSLETELLGVTMQLQKMWSSIASQVFCIIAG
jgi:hypothetical protein